MSLNLKLKRAYETPSRADGYRVLVDRLWPRGVAKADAGIDAWAKELAPSNDLRKDFHQGRLDWAAFQQAYCRELDEQEALLQELRTRAQEGPVTLVYAARDTKQNNAVALRDYLERMA